MQYESGEEEQQIAIPSTFQGIEDTRAAIVENLNAYAGALSKLAELFTSQNLHLSTVTKDGTCPYDGAIDIPKIMKSVDARLWDLAINSSNVARVLSSQGEEDLKKRYKDNPPEFTADGAMHLIERLGESTPMLAAKMVAEIFNKIIDSKFIPGNSWRGEKQARCYKAIEESFRFSHFHGGVCPDSYMSEQNFVLFNDLEAVCALVMDQPRPVYPNRLGDQMQSYQTGYRKGVMKYSTKYFDVQLFLNGNVKLDFTCEKTRELLNRYGGADGKRLAGTKETI